MIIQTADFCFWTQQQPCAAEFTAPVCAHSPEYTQGSPLLTMCTAVIVCSHAALWSSMAKIALHWFWILQPLTHVLAPKED